MICGYFGLPGCGKSTFLAKFSQQFLKRGIPVFVHKDSPVHGCYLFDWNDLGRFDMSGSVILIDEISLRADNRDYKNFSDTVELCEKRLDNLYRARMNIRRIVWCNECQYTKMITLTYAKTCLDVVRVRRDITTFVQAMRRKGYEFNYIYVLEHQKERGLKEGNAGSLHVHMILFLQRYIKLDDLNSAWPHGNTDILATDEVRDLGAYISKYISKENFADFGKRCYSCSLGLKRSSVERFYTLRYSDNLIDTEPEKFLEQCNITYRSTMRFDYIDADGLPLAQQLKYFQGKWKNGNAIAKATDPLNEFTEKLKELDYLI